MGYAWPSAPGSVLLPQPLREVLVLDGYGWLGSPSLTRFAVTAVRYRPAAGYGGTADGVWAAERSAGDVQQHVAEYLWRWWRVIRGVEGWSARLPFTPIERDCDAWRMYGDGRPSQSRW
jgi:hypothetical protein